MKKCTVCAQTFRNTTATGSPNICLQIHGLLSGNDDGQWRLDNYGKVAPQSLLPIQETQMSFVVHLSEWVISILQPFDTVEQHNFVKMITAASSCLVAPAARSIRKRFLQIEEEEESIVKAKIACGEFQVSLTADTWSSRVYKGYMIVTGHYVDSDLSMKCVILEFNFFHTPHIGGAAEAFLKEVIEHWRLTERVRAITSDNVSDVVLGMSFLYDWLSEKDPMIYKNSSQFYIRCFANIPNLATMECMKEIYGHIEKIGSLPSTLRSSVKKRDLSNDFIVKLCLKV